MCVQEKESNGTADDWQLMKLSPDDVTMYDDDDDDDDVNSLAAGEAMTSLGVHHVLYTLTDLTANSSYTGRLRAKNIFGSSDWSSEFSFRTALQRVYT